MAEVRAEDGHECKHEWADYGFQLVPQYYHSAVCRKDFFS